MANSKKAKFGKIISARFIDQDHTRVELVMGGEKWIVPKKFDDGLWNEIAKQDIKVIAYVAPEMSKDEFYFHCKKEINRIRTEVIPADAWDDLNNAEKSKWKKYIKALNDLQKSPNLNGITSGDGKAAKSKMPKLPN